MLMWFNKSVIIINVMLKILDITSLRSIYIYIYIFFFFNKFGFRIGTNNPNISFTYMYVHKNGPK